MSKSQQDTQLLGGAVVSENKIASEIGTRILAAGGNAADAIIATTIAVNTTSPYHSDLGGAGLAIIRTPTGDFESLNFRGCAPVSELTRAGTPPSWGH